MRSFIAACLFAFAVAQDENDTVTSTSVDAAEEEFVPAAECYEWADAIARYVMGVYGNNLIRVFGSDSWTVEE